MKYSILLPALCLALILPVSSKAAEDTATKRAIVFPTVASAVTFKDDYSAPRAGHSHIGIDLIGPKMTPLYAAVDGVVSYIVIPEASWGYQIVIKDAEGWTYHYIHINNDTPGTNDGKGGPENAYAPGLKKGSTVTKGQLVGWMGDSGNAEGVTSHLHFEIHQPNGTPINPYESLIAAKGGSVDLVAPSEPTSPLPVGTTDDGINTDRNLINIFSNNCLSGSLIKTASNSAVYYCGADGKRYAFPNDKVYFSWYKDFSSVVTISADKLAAVPIGGLVTYKPGSRMVKITSMANVYHVEKNGVLRWVTSEAMATSMYGADWAKKIDDLNDAF
ncbi:MAG: M23 family metallopeptidase [Candidatus Nomurabacteria bacterium]|nr:MAG: M23 family metallopeptidase [Candidatus Nomurabacteria bacterium]